MKLLVAAEQQEQLYQEKIFRQLEKIFRHIYNFSGGQNLSA